MSFFLAKRILLFSSSSSPFHRHHFHQLLLLTPLLRHSLSTQSKELPFIAQYLISSFAFSPARALKCSAYSSLRAIKSSERPESVVAFLKDTGLSHDQIQDVVSFHPRILTYNVEKTLKPKMSELMGAGFSGELLVHLIRYNPTALVLKATLLRLLFWIDFVGNNDEVLLKIIKMNPLLLTLDIDNQIGKRCTTKNLDSLRQILELIEEMGIERGSRMFLWGLKAIGGYSNDKIKRKVEFFLVTYGWSEEEVHAAFRKYPALLTFSANKVKSNMDFLMKKAGFGSRSIALQPRLFGCSVERVLVPRYTVLSTLQANGLKKMCSLLAACVISESNFLQKYVVPYEKEVPGVGEAYAASRGGKVPV
ncbi:hypothetical protein LUZ62_001280 [Rhynchospora pubera]|uniref:Uncharacterized protein n=1 Tax=Rhynchospora pubera TaxID=906938 RepID=A0AAV8BP72_9POAL|nr:hypothetical protein LUZ62_001280 [Rhynchospora pubera]